MNRNLAALLPCLLCAPAHFTGAAEARFTDRFDVDKADLASVGTNRFFVLAPGFQQVLEGRDARKTTVLTITVLPETKVVDGVETRVVEERETVDGQIAEISRNYFAICRRTTDVFYFGEDVDINRGGKIRSHEGAWLSGVAGARFGLLLPGTPLLGARYQQEVAPKVAMDRAEIASLTEEIKVPAGTYKNCLKTKESSALESGTGEKLYAPGVGLLKDAEFDLAKVEMISEPKGGKAADGAPVKE